MKKKMLILSLVSCSFFAGAADAPQASNSNLLCELFGLGCPVVTPSTGGNGAEPPKSNTQG